jgi:glycerol-3-phosphate O-acyltransferase
VGFGAPLELARFREGVKGDLTEAVAAELMARIAAVVPVLSVPLVAYALLHSGAQDRAGLVSWVDARLDELAARDIPGPRRKAGPLVEETLDRLIGRGLVSDAGGRMTATDDGRDVLAYYANTIAQHMPTH